MRYATASKEVRWSWRRFELAERERIYQDRLKAAFGPDDEVLKGLQQQIEYIILETPLEYLFPELVPRPPVVPPVSRWVKVCTFILHTLKKVLP